MERLRQSRVQSLKGLEKLLRQQKALSKDLKNLEQRTRFSLSSSRSSLCAAIYRSIKHTLIDAVEQFYQYRFDTLCEELFSDRNELSAAVNLCVAKLESIRDILAAVLTYEQQREPPRPCSDNFAKGYKQGFQDGLSSLTSYLKGKLEEVGEIQEGTPLSRPESVDDVHRKFPASW